jgi:sporulation protein YqfC
VAGYGKWEREGLKDEAHPLVPYQCTEDLDLKIYQPDQAEGMKPADAAVMEGRLIGGCMDCLVNLLGTRFDKVEAFVENYKGIIEYTSQMILLQGKTCKIEICGRRLNIVYYTNEDMKINGCVETVRYLM